MGTDRRTAISANQIKNNTLTDDELSTTNEAVDGYILSYDLATGKFTWIAAGGAGGDHNDLSNIDGGTTDEYYHLNSADYTELTEWLDNVTLGSDGKLTLPSGVAINEFSSDGTLAGDSDDAVPTEKAVKKYVDDNAGSSPLTTKGDLFGYSTLGARLPVGSDDQILVADSAEDLGVKWADFGDGYSYFVLWAEESYTTTTDAYEWSWGNGDEAASGGGAVVGVDCELYAIGVAASSTNTDFRISVNKNTVLAGTSDAQIGLSNFTAITPVAFSQGDILDFRTHTAGLSSAGVRVFAYFRVVVKGQKGDTGEAGDNITLNEQLADYTLVLTDVNNLIEMNKGTAVTLTVPANADVAFPTGATVGVIQKGAGQVTIEAVSGVTINSKDGLLLTGQYAGATLTKVATDTWYLNGNTGEA